MHRVCVQCCANQTMMISRSHHHPHSHTCSCGEVSGSNSIKWQVPCKNLTEVKHPSAHALALSTPTNPVWRLLLQVVSNDAVEIMLVKQLPSHGAQCTNVGQPTSPHPFCIPLPRSDYYTHYIGIINLSEINTLDWIFLPSPLAVVAHMVFL